MLDEIVSWILALLKVAIGLLISLACVIYYVQDRLLYFPQVPQGANGIEEYPVTPERLGIPFEHVDMVTEDGVEIVGWLMKQKGDRFGVAPTMVYFHGNAGNIAHRLLNAGVLYELGMNVFAVEYRGFGVCKGNPTEKGIKLDGEAAMKHLLSRDDIDLGKVFVFGRSLGGAVAIHLAKEFGDAVNAIIVENTFMSVDDMIDVVLPLLSPFKALCTNRLRSRDIIGDLKQPILFLSGRADELIPPTQMDSLYALVKSDHKTFKSFLNGDHNETFKHTGYYREVYNWIAEVFGSDSLIPKDQVTAKVRGGLDD